MKGQIPWKNHILPKLTQRETDIKNISKETEVIVKNLITNKTPSPGGFTGEY
mgnify:CR=1 FL=1